MSYDEAVAEVARLREGFDKPFGDSDKRSVVRLYMEVLGKTFRPTTCQQCYHDALIEVHLFLKKEKTMKKRCGYRLRAGVVISCPDFRNGKIFTNDNLTDEVAKEYLDKFPKAERLFQVLPDEDEDRGQESASDPTEKEAKAKRTTK